MELLSFSQEKVISMFEGEFKNEVKTNFLRTYRKVIIFFPLWALLCYLGMSYEMANKFDGSMLSSTNLSEVQNLELKTLVRAAYAMSGKKLAVGFILFFTVVQIP